jgi:hypothetical protein
MLFRRFTVLENSLEIVRCGIVLESQRRRDQQGRLRFDVETVLPASSYADDDDVEDVEGERPVPGPIRILERIPVAEEVLPLYER